jgi:hypothetical protein
MHRRGSVRVVGLLSSLLGVAWLSSSVACGGASEEKGAAPSTSAPPVSTASGGSAPAPRPDAAPVGSNAGDAESPAAASDTPLIPVRTEPAGAGGAGAVDACAALGSGDACGTCVCSECRAELDACLGVPGCAEILACVRESGCSGRECYCGEASLTECVRGEANGPCRDVVLAAPGGKAPTIVDASGGPASDAALGVSDCADEDDTCQEVCSLDE